MVENGNLNRAEQLIGGVQMRVAASVLPPEAILAATTYDAVVNNSSQLTCRNGTETQMVPLFPVLYFVFDRMNARSRRIFTESIKIIGSFARELTQLPDKPTDVD